MSVNAIDPNQMLAQMHSMIREAQNRLADQAAPVAAPGGPAAAGLTGVEPPGQTDFAGLLRQAVEQVNAQQQASSRLTADFVAERPGVTLTEVMVASQKAGVAFQAVTQVRNRMISAYQEIMSMQV